MLERRRPRVGAVARPARQPTPPSSRSSPSVTASAPLPGGSGSTRPRRRGGGPRKSSNGDSRLAPAAEHRQLVGRGRRGAGSRPRPRSPERRVRSRQGRACSSCADSDSSVSSSAGRPTSCTPIGSPSGDTDSGTLTAGWPLVLKRAVKGVHRVIRANSCSGSPVSLKKPSSAGGCGDVGQQQHVVRGGRVHAPRASPPAAPRSARAKSLALFAAARARAASGSAAAAAPPAPAAPARSPR